MPRTSRAYSTVPDATDDVCARFGRKKGSLHVRRLDAETILIEGTARDLRFLGSLLLALAGRGSGCGRHIGPATAGSRHFSPDPGLGLYIHRVPCEDGPVPSTSRSGPSAAATAPAPKPPRATHHPRPQSKVAT